VRFERVLRLEPLIVGQEVPVSVDEEEVAAATERPRHVARVHVDREDAIQVPEAHEREMRSSFPSRSWTELAW
jgi:hypothetical protein